MEYQRPKTELHKAILLILIAALFNTLMILFVKIAAESLSLPIVLFARYFITFIIILPFIYFNPAAQSVGSFLKTKRLPLHLFRDVFGLISVLCYFYAASTISLADATVLFNTAPLFIPMIAFFWGGLKIFHRLWWGMGLGFFGVILILHPGHELFHLALFLGLISGICAAIVFVGGRYLTYSEPPLRNMFYYFIVGTVIAAVMLIFSHENLSAVFNIKSGLLLLCIGVCGYLYQLCFTHGSKYAPVRLTSSFLYSSVIFSIFLDWFIWRIIPNMISLIGIICIIMGACLLLFLYPKEDYVKRR